MNIFVSFNPFSFLIQNVLFVFQDDSQHLTNLGSFFIFSSRVQLDFTLSRYWQHAVYENYSLVLVQESEKPREPSVLSVKEEIQRKTEELTEFRGLQGYQRIRGEEKSKRRKIREPIEKKEKRNLNKNREKNSQRRKRKTPERRKRKELNIEMKGKKLQRRKRK